MSMIARRARSLLLAILAATGCSRGGLDEGPAAPDLGQAADLGAGCSPAAEFACGGGLVCDPCTLRCVAMGAACAPDLGGDLGGDLGAARPGCQPQPGLGACYSFDEDGAQVVDGSGNRNDGVLEGGGWRRVPGRFGGALAFDGADGRAHVRSSPTLDFATGSTVEFWIKIAFDPNNTGSVSEIASRGTGNNDNAVSFWSTCGNACALWQHAGTGTSSVCSPCGAVKQDAWSFVAIVNDGTESRSYVDGVLRSTQPGGRFVALTSDLYIGRRVQGIFSLKGTIDELRWWTVARTEPQMCQDAGGRWTGASCSLP